MEAIILPLNLILDAGEKMAEAWVAGDKDRVRRIISELAISDFQSGAMGMAASHMHYQLHAPVPVLNGFLAEVMNPHLDKKGAFLYAPLTEEWLAKKLPLELKCVSCDHSMWAGVESGPNCPGCNSLMEMLA